MLFRSNGVSAWDRLGLDGPSQSSQSEVVVLGKFVVTAPRDNSGSNLDSIGIYISVGGSGGNSVVGVLSDNRSYTRQVDNVRDAERIRKILLKTNGSVRFEPAVLALLFRVEPESNSVAPSDATHRFSDSELQLVGSGYGDVYHRTYTATMSTRISAAVINKALQGNINNFTGSWNPSVDTPFSPARGSSLAIQLGNVYQVDGPGLVNPFVAVTGVTNSSFTFTTMKGHVEAGSITFSAEQVEPNTVVFTIESTAQSSSMVNEIGRAHV